MSPRLVVLFVCSMAASLGLALIAQEKREGYKDTPILPGQKWHVHDPDRPYPHEVTPGATLGEPPSDAIVLFDGKDLSQWMQTDNGLPNGKPHDPRWRIQGEDMVVSPRTGDLYTKQKFGDCQLHIEWLEPADIDGTGQSRGNSGVFLMSQFEIQVLDSYRAHTYADGQAAAIYGQWPPLVNPMRKPGEWQSYDIVFEAPRFEGAKLVQPAFVTVFFNGVLVHNHQKLNGPTGHRVIPTYTDFEPEGRLRLQDHNSTRSVRFRNIWIRRLAGYDQPEQ